MLFYIYNQEKYNFFIILYVENTFCVIFFNKNTRISFNFTNFHDFFQLLIKQRVHKNSNFTLVLFKMAENVKRNQRTRQLFVFQYINDADCNQFATFNIQYSSCFSSNFFSSFDNEFFFIFHPYFFLHLYLQTIFQTFNILVTRQETIKFIQKNLP